MEGVTTAAGVGRDSFMTGVGLPRLGRQADCNGRNGEHFRLGVEVTLVNRETCGARWRDNIERLMTLDQRPFSLNDQV